MNKVFNVKKFALCVTRFAVDFVIIELLPYFYYDDFLDLPANSYICMMLILKQKRIHQITLILSISKTRREGVPPAKTIY